MAFLSRNYVGHGKKKKKRVSLWPGLLMEHGVQILVVVQNKGNQNTTHVAKPSRFHFSTMGKKWDWISYLKFSMNQYESTCAICCNWFSWHLIWIQFETNSKTSQQQPTAAPPSCELMVVHVAQASKLAWHAPELKQSTKTWHRNSQQVCLHMET